MGKIGDLWVKLKLKSDDYKKGLENAKQETKDFGSWVKQNWMKVTAGIAAATAAIKAFSKGVAIIADFEKANSVLAGVLGKTVAEIKALSDSAEMLGRSTAFTATQVTGLQTELAKLGFGEGQIMSMQKAVLNFATALGVDLSEAASFTGATLRTFGLKASDAEDALNVLAVASDKSALGFSALSTAMPIVGPVAKSLGFSLRDTSTLLGVLANSGFDASSAATALRNIFLYLADSSSNLSKAIGKPVKTLPDLLDGLDKLKSQGISVGEALELTDKRAVSAFNTLIDGTASARELRSALDDVNGAVDAKAQAQIDNISGSVSLLKSAWEGLILGMKNSKGVIKIVLDMLTRTLEKAAGLFRGTRVQNYQKTYADAATNVYKGGGKEEAETYMQNQLKAKQDKVAELQALSQETVSPFESTPTAAARAAKRKLKDAQEQLEGMKAAYAAVADQIANDAVTDAVNTAGDGGTETADALLEAFKKALSNDKVQDAMSDFRAQVAEEAEVIAADEEFQKMADPLEEFEKSHAELLDRLNHKQQIFADMSQDAYAKAAKSAYDYETAKQSALDLADEATQKELDNLRASQEKAAELNNSFSEAIAAGLSDSAQAFTDMLFNLEGADSSAVLGALLQPFANMSKQLGEMLIIEGLGIKAFKESMKSLNPYVAIAAGTALVALGAALSSGIKALGSSGGSSAMSSGSSATSNANSDTTISTEMTIYVKGKISGKDILISGDNAKKYYGR